MGKIKTQDTHPIDFLQASCEYSPFGITWTDLLGNILFANDPVLRIFQFPADEFAGSKIQDLLTPSSLDEWKDASNSIISHGELDRRWTSLTSWARLSPLTL